MDVVALEHQFATAPVVCGLRPLVADGCPILGRVEGFSNLYLNTGKWHVVFTLVHNKVGRPWLQRLEDCPWRWPRRCQNHGQ